MEKNPMSDFSKSAWEIIRDAQVEAFKHGIKANTIMINDNLCAVKPHIFETFGGVSQVPPMICGMNVYWTKSELPDDYAFAIFESSRDRLAEFESIGMEPEELRKAAELYRKVKEMV